MTEREPRVRTCRAWAASAPVFAGLMFCLPLPSAAIDLMAPKEQQDTEIDTTKLPEFDLQQRGVPQSLFAWIKMAKGYEIQWDTFGRQGWYTQDPRFKPVEPTSVFPPSTEIIYIVFESAPVEDPIQYSAQWFLLDAEGKAGEVPVGKDILEQPGHSRYGFLELRPTGGAWKPGKYLVRLYIAPIGQQPFHAGNQVGTMRFLVTDQPAQAASPPAP